MRYFKPFNSNIDLVRNNFKPEGELIIRRLSNMKNIFQNKEAVKECLGKGDPVIYQFYNARVPIKNEHLQHCLSIIFPGKIGNEYFMTKGHFHQIQNTAEIYLTLKGKGKLVMQAPNEQSIVLDMNEGTVSYIPPCWAHRTVNTGNEPLVFFATYRGDAGHDYKNIEKKGFCKLIVENNGEIEVKNNSNFYRG